MKNTPKSTPQNARPVKENLRKFPRAVLVDPSGNPLPLAEAYVIWPDTGEKLAIFDLSYQGLAFSRPTSDSFGPSGQRTLVLILGEKRVKVSVEYVRETDRLVAVRLVSLAAQDRLLFDEFFYQKLLGVLMRKVAPDFYSSIADFDHWFSGPQDTNLYLWQSDSGELQRFQLQTGDWVVEWESQRLTFKNISEKSNLLDELTAENQRRVQNRAFEIISQIRGESESQLLHSALKILSDQNP